MVWDLRGGWGGAQPQYLDLFNPRAPTMKVTGRNGETGFVDVKWRKPVFSDQRGHPQRQGSSRLWFQGISTRRARRPSHRRRGAGGDGVPDRRRRAAPARGRGRAGRRPAPRRGGNDADDRSPVRLCATRRAATHSSTAPSKYSRALNRGLHGASAAPIDRKRDRGQARSRRFFPRSCSPPTSRRWSASRSRS